ncbi:hypothetical protein Pmar_PMAR004964, partial [Perkinsus marinus ATCC 50983]
VAARMQHIIINSSNRCHHMVVLLGWAWPGEQEEQGHMSQTHSVRNGAKGQMDQKFSKQTLLN